MVAEECYIAPLNAIEKAHRHDSWAGRRAMIEVAMEQMNAPAKRLERFRCCGSGCVVQWSEELQRHRMSANYCHDRLCIPCGQARSRIIARNLRDKIGKDPFRFFTLTLKHANVPLSTQISRLLTCFRNLRSQEVWKSTQKGGAAFLEIKRARNGKEWHPHLHIVAVGTWIDQYALSNAWLATTGDSSIVDVRFCREESEVCSYVAKYASKPLDSTVFENADWLLEASIALKGRRLCTTFGGWRGSELSATPEDPGDWQSIASLAEIYQARNRGELWAAGILKSLAQKSDVRKYEPINNPPDLPPDG